MKPTIFRGAGVAIVTPMHQDGSINFEKFTELMEEQIAAGTDALIVCGTTGESATLDHAEHLEVIDHAVSVVAGRIPVIAGTGSNDTRYAIELSVAAQDIGADALLLVTPYYNKCSQKGLVLHYNAIADAVDLPMIVYNVPSRTGLNIQPGTYWELAKHPNIVATKEANGNVSALAETVALCGDDLQVYSGNDDQVLPALAYGGLGVISVLSNIVPDKMHELCQRYFDGDTAGSAKLQTELMALNNAIFCEVNPVPIKTAMNLMGKDVGPLRLPLCEMSDEHLAALKQVLIDYQLLEA